MNHILSHHPKIFKRLRVLKKQFSKNTTLLVSTSFSPSVLHLQLVPHATPPLRERVWCKGKPARTSGIPAGQSDPFCHINFVSTAHFFASEHSDSTPLPLPCSLLLYQAALHRSAPTAARTDESKSTVNFEHA